MSVHARAKQTLILESEEHQSLTALLSHGDHGVMANQAGDEGQRAGPQVLYHSRHKRPSQGLFKCPAGRRVLGFIAVRDDDIGDPLLNKANVRERERELHTTCHMTKALTNEGSRQAEVSLKLPVSPRNQILCFMRSCFASQWLGFIES